MLCDSKNYYNKHVIPHVLYNGFAQSKPKLLLLGFPSGAPGSFYLANAHHRKPLPMGALVQARSRVPISQ